MKVGDKSFRIIFKKTIFAFTTNKKCRQWIFQIFNILEFHCLKKNYEKCMTEEIFEKNGKGKKMLL